MSLYDSRSLSQARRRRATQRERARRRLRPRVSVRYLQCGGVGDAAGTAPWRERRPICRARDLGSITREAPRSARLEGKVGDGIPCRRTDLIKRPAPAKSYCDSRMDRLAVRGSMHCRPRGTCQLNGPRYDRPSSEPQLGRAIALPASAARSTTNSKRASCHHKRAPGWCSTER